MNSKLEQHLAQGMTVGDLIDYLEDFDREAVVMYSYPAGDYWNSVVASNVTTVAEGFVDWSEYFRQPYMPKTADEVVAAKVVVIT